MANHSDINCVNRGRGGELILIIRVASSGNVWVSVDNLMKGLLLPSKHQFFMGSFGVVEKGELLYRRSLGRSEATAFCLTIFSADNLWKFITRVAMLLCSFYREGIDIAMIAWPVCDPQRNGILP